MVSRLKLASTADPRAERLQNALGARLGQERMQTWFGHSPTINVYTDQIEIQVADELAIEVIRQRFVPAIVEAVEEVFAVSARVYLYTPSDHGQAHRTLLPSTARATSRRSKAAADAVGCATAKLRENHRLDNFVVGPSNRRAFDAISALATDRQKPNVLILIGHTGLGKTHLLQALCREFKNTFPDSSARYITAEEFVAEWLRALREGMVTTFRRTMGSVNLLAVDDISFVQGPEGRVALIGVINMIRANGGQVVLTSEEYPQADVNATGILRGLIAGNVVVPIDPPSYQTRCEFLKMYGRSTTLALSEEMISLIARLVIVSIRELEGVCVRISATAALEGRKLDLDLVKKILETVSDDELRVSSAQSFDLIISTVAEYFHVDPEKIKTGHREQPLCKCRALALYLSRTMLRTSYPELARLIGCPNHSSAISSCRRVEAAIASRETWTWVDGVGDHAALVSDILDYLRAKVCRAR